MAQFVNMEAVQALIQKVYSGALARTLLEMSPAWSILQARGKIITDPRLELRWPAVKEAFDGVTNIADGEDLPASSSEEYGDAFLKFSIFIGLVRVGRMAQMGAQNTQEFFSSETGARLLGTQVNAAIRQMSRQIHLQIVGVNSLPKQLVGLGEAVGKNDNIYANIDRVGNAFWQPYINDNGGINRALTEGLLRDMHDTLSYQRGAQISEVWAGTTAFNALEDMLTGRVRLMNPEELRGGAVRLFWRNVQFVRMPDMDPNSMYWLDMDSDEGIKLKRQHDTDFITRPEATNSYDDRISIAGHYQLVVNNPFRQGALHDVQ